MQNKTFPNWLNLFVLPEQEMINAGERERGSSGRARQLQRPYASHHVGRVASGCLGRGAVRWASHWASSVQSGLQEMEIHSAGFDLQFGHWPVSVDSARSAHGTPHPHGRRLPF